jgi:hypothetical protein
LRRPHAPRPKGICGMRLLHSARDTSAQFDDPNLVSCAGLVPVMRLAQDCGLAELVAEHLAVAGTLGANAPFKIGCVVGGMIAGADSIDDLDVLRHGGMGGLFDGCGRRPRWVRSCGRSPGATSASSRRSTGGCWPSWRPGPRCWLTRTSWPSSTSTRVSGGCTGTPSRASGSATPRSAGIRCGCAGSTR